MKNTKITVLGSGTCVPSLTRRACSILVETGDKNILLDAGPGTMHRLLEAGLTVFDLTHIFLSHFHPDHTGELVTLLFASKYPKRTRRTSPLTVVAGKGFKVFFEGLRGVFGDWIDLGEECLHIMELKRSGPDAVLFDRVLVETTPVIHNPESLAYRITGADGRSVVYSGDTDECEDLVRLADGADILICEAALPDQLKVPGHLTPALAGKLAARAGVGKLVLTHFYPECEAVDMAAQCRKTYEGPLVLAEDLMVLSN